MMKKTIVYVHGKGGNAREAEHYQDLFPDCTVIGFDYMSSSPWEAKKEFAVFADELCRKNGPVILIANSIGAYFSMHALSSVQVEKAFLISPVADMEGLIMNMMKYAGVTEEELQRKQEIETGFGETLSWQYLQYAKNNPASWDVPTWILYGENDQLTSYETIRQFAERIHAHLTVMENGEHWFHTDEQMAFLDAWIREAI